MNDQARDARSWPAGGRSGSITASWPAMASVQGTGRDARRYLRGRGLTEQAAGRAAAQVAVPVRLTKRGALIWARNAA